MTVYCERLKNALTQVKIHGQSSLFLEFYEFSDKEKELMNKISDIYHIGSTIYTFLFHMDLKESLQFEDKLSIHQMMKLKECSLSIHFSNYLHNFYAFKKIDHYCCICNKLILSTDNIKDLIFIAKTTNIDFNSIFNYLESIFA